MATEIPPNYRRLASGWLPAGDRFASAPPADPQRVGSDAEAPRGRSERSGPHPTFCGRSGTTPAWNTLPSDAACGVRRKGVLLSIQEVRPFGVSSLVVQLRPLHPVLPNCFASWSQVLTDWHVRGALAKSRLPRSLASHPELAAPLVAEIGRAIRVQQIDRRSVQTALERDQVVEPTYDDAGGPDYVAVRHAMEQSQHRYFSIWPKDINSADAIVSRTEMKRLQAEFFAIRRRHAPQVAEAQNAALRRYWSNRWGRGLGDDFYADCGKDSIPALMSRTEPAWWWREFFLRLQRRCQRYHAADGVFLDHLPAIRARVSAKKLSAEIAEWSKGMSDRWGWDGPGHYRMLADRAAAKADALAAWYNRTVPGYLADANMRDSLCSRLVAELGSRDPWRKSANSEPAAGDANGRN